MFLCNWHNCILAVLDWIIVNMVTYVSADLNTSVFISSMALSKLLRYHNNTKCLSRSRLCRHQGNSCFNVSGFTVMSHWKYMLINTCSLYYINNFQCLIIFRTKHEYLKSANSELRTYIKYLFRFVLFSSLI